MVALAAASAADTADAAAVGGAESKDWMRSKKVAMVDVRFCCLVFAGQGLGRAWDLGTRTRVKLGIGTRLALGDSRGHVPVVIDKHGTEHYRSSLRRIAGIDHVGKTNNVTSGKFASSMAPARQIITPTALPVSFIPCITNSIAPRVQGVVGE